MCARAAPAGSDDRRRMALSASLPDVASRVTSGAVHVFVLESRSAGTITDRLLGELEDALEAAGADPRCRALVLSSRDGVFCTGMDLGEAAATHRAHDRGAKRFFDVLLGFTRLPVILVAAVDGRATGGGVGMAAACDFVAATPRSEFALPEALWGLLPCCALPFIERRIGPRHAYAMSLGTLPMDARAAREVGLVDFVDDDLARALAPLLARATKLARPTVAALKQYACEQAPVTEARRRASVRQLAELLDSAAVRDALARYAAERRFPWEP